MKWIAIWVFKTAMVVRKKRIAYGSGRERDEMEGVVHRLGVCTVAQVE